MHRRRAAHARYESTEVLRGLRRLRGRRRRAPADGGGEDWRKFIVEEPAEDPLAQPLSAAAVKGYVLLGKQCPAKDCPSPLMRAPDGREVCVQPACVAARMLEEDDDEEDDFVVEARNDDEVRLPPPVPGASALGAHLIRGYAMPRTSARTRAATRRSCGRRTARTGVSWLRAPGKDVGAPSLPNSSPAAPFTVRLTARACEVRRGRQGGTVAGAGGALQRRHVKKRPRVAGSVADATALCPRGRSPFLAAARACVGKLRDQARGIVAARACGVRLWACRRRARWRLGRSAPSRRRTVRQAAGSVAGPAVGEARSASRCLRPSYW